MSTFTQKSGERDSRATNAGFVKKESNARSTPELTDQRPEALTQRALDDNLNRSVKVQSQLQLQQMFDQSPRVAAQMKLAALLSPHQNGQPAQPTMQRQTSVEEEKPLQDKSETMQRVELAEEEELLQGKFGAMQREEMSEEEEPLQGRFEPVQQKENRTGMPDNLKAGVENLSGLSMDDVKVHYNSAAPATVQALAYTQGTEIHVGPGQEQHVAHEAWHVAQQKQGRVRPTMQTKGVTINDDASLEQEADRMGAKALQKVSDVQQSSDQMVSGPVNSVSYDDGPAQAIQKFDPEKEKAFYEKQADRWRLSMPWDSKEEDDRNAILKKVLKETYALLDSSAVSLVSVNGNETTGVTPKGGEREDRTYKIEINTQNPWGEANAYNPTENRIRSIIMHELTHVAADQTYRLNDTTNETWRAYNVDTEDERMSVSEDDTIYRELMRVIGLVDTDPAFSTEEKKYVKFRLNRAQSWQQELDTVVNELLYYFDLEGVSPSSPTSIAITRLAEARYARRSARKSPIVEKEERIKENIADELRKQTLAEFGL